MNSDEMLDDAQDDTPTCPECGKRAIRDWEGDPGVIGGTRDFYACPDCGYEIVDNDSPLAVTESFFAWARKNGLME